MYSKFNPINIVLKYAYEYVVKNDRQQYHEYFRVTEEFISKNNLILGGNISIDMLIANNKGLDKQKLLNYEYLSKIGSKKHYIIYSKQPFIHANELADIFLNLTTLNINFPKDYIMINTQVKNKEIHIKINNRTLMKFINIPKYKGVPLYDLIDVKKIKGLFSDKEINVLYDAHLIDIYHKLYIPNESKNWGLLINYENELYNSLKQDFISKYTKILSNQPNKEITGSSESKLNLLSQIYYKILKKMSDMTYMGANQKSSIKILFLNIGNKYFNQEESKIQLLTNGEQSVKEIVAELNLLDLPIECNFNYKEFEVNLLEDIQLKKWIIYGNIHNKNQSIIMEIYNSLQYELIPYYEISETIINSEVTGKGSHHNSNKKHDQSKTKTKFETKTKEYKKEKISLLMANILVQLRFIFIEIWTMRIILNIFGAKNDNTPMLVEIFIRNIKKIIDRADKLHAHFKTYENTLDITKIFQITNYAGIYIDPMDIQKKMLDDLGVKQIFYYPGKKK